MEFNFESILMEALSNIKQKYFKVTTINESIIRERVFCYELYHQMRLLLPDNEFDFNGEIDKSGHKNFDKSDKKNPDFIYHIQGEFSPESIIIEVKGLINSEKIHKDFNTLSLFINNYNYGKGYFILYNRTFAQFKRYFKLEQNYTYNHHITILCKKDSASTVEKHHISELINGV